MVMLSFAATKSVELYKRKVLNNKFESAVHVAAMKMEDSEMFVLHPYDERVVERIVKMGGKYFFLIRKRVALSSAMPCPSSPCIYTPENTFCERKHSQHKFFQVHFISK